MDYSMTIINKANLNILKADDGKLIRNINDKEQTLEDGTTIEPYRTDTIYLSKLITTMKQVKEIYVEEDI